jgi:cytochrome c oxidase subunit 2
MRATGRSVFLFAMTAAVPASAAPLQYLTGAGAKAGPVVGLTWGVLAISVIVIVAIAALLAGAVWRRPGLAATELCAGTALGKAEGGLNWLWIGVGATSLVLLFTIVWTVSVLAGIEAPFAKPAFTIRVTGHQWWWEVRYIGRDPSRSFTTADEIHIPVGVPVRLRLVGGDVIHSFWVPQLGGKMDAIPGQTNETWLEADTPGAYRGQCTEYCGLQHAHMGFVVIAEPRARFQAWWARQLQLPGTAATPGARDFVMHCGACHAVRGTDAAGSLGPDLSHLMERTSIAAATMTNNPANLAHWISDPQSIKPGASMQAPELSAAELADIHAYLKTLK